MQDIKTLLNQKGLKTTHQRLVIYKAVLESKQHPTAEQIYEALKYDNPSLSLGTVYKTLSALAEVGLLRKVESMDGQLRYDGKIDDHHHIYCQNTQEIVDFEDPKLNEMISEYLEKKKINNLEIHSISLHITGFKPYPDQEVIITSNSD